MAFLFKRTASFFTVFVLHMALTDVLVPQPAFADEDYPAAIKQTQDMMKNKAEREKAIRGDKKSEEADAFAGKAAGGDPNKKEEIYDISSEVFAALMKSNNNDSAKVQDQLQQALKNPEAFANSLPADLRARIKAVSEKQGSEKP